jgi:DNA repair protein RadC
VQGLGAVRAARIAAALELGQRAARRGFESTTRIASSAHAADWGLAHLGHLEHEELWCLSLSRRGSIRGTHRLASGGDGKLVVSAREALRAVLRDGAAGFLLFHNHPSGDPTPSVEDVEFTHSILRSAHAVELRLLDHVVVGHGRCVSMAAHGLLDELRADAYRTRRTEQMLGIPLQGSRAAAAAAPPTASLGSANRVSSSVGE